MQRNGKRDPLFESTLLTFKKPNICAADCYIALCHPLHREKGIWLQGGKKGKPLHRSESGKSIHVDCKGNACKTKNGEVRMGNHRTQSGARGPAVTPELLRSMGIEVRSKNHKSPEEWPPASSKEGGYGAWLMNVPKCEQPSKTLKHSPAIQSNYFSRARWTLG